MPLKNRRTEAGLRKGKFKTSGRQTVTYVDAKRRSRAATVLDQGTSSGLKIQLADLTRTVVDNVPQCTTRTSTGCYISRL